MFLSVFVYVFIYVVVYVFVYVFVLAYVCVYVYVWAYVYVYVSVYVYVYVSVYDYVYAIAISLHIGGVEKYGFNVRLPSTRNYRNQRPDDLHALVLVTSVTASVDCSPSSRHLMYAARW